MRPAIAFLLLIGVALAAPINVTVENPGNYAAIGYSFPFENPLPGYSYRGNITAQWNIPDSSLAGIDATEVPLYITLSAPDGGPVKFAGGLMPQQSAQIKLICYVSEGACANDSVLDGSAAVLFSPSGAGDNGSVFVNVSTTPGPGIADEIVGAAQGISSGITASGMNGSQNGTPLSSLIPASNATSEAYDSAPSPIGLGSIVGVIIVLVFAVIAGWFWLRNRR